MFDIAPKAPDQIPKPSMKWSGVRKDGKFLVRFNYPGTGRTIGKLLTAAQLQTEMESGKYVIAR